MELKDLTREEAIALIAKIAHNLQHIEDGNDYCFWLAEVLEKEAGLKVDFFTL